MSLYDRSAVPLSPTVDPSTRSASLTFSGSF
jgi:hypothetical protein